MHFCTRCRNLYYVRVNLPEAPTAGVADHLVDEHVFDNGAAPGQPVKELAEQDSLVYYCRNCGHVDTVLKPEAVCLTDSAVAEQKDQYKYMINRYLKYDPTLPHVTNIRCPNAECPTSQPDGTVSSDVLYVRYDDQDLKYVYMCTVCDAVWHNT
jgi:hypothetical protein